MAGPRRRSCSSSIARCVAFTTGDPSAHAPPNSLTSHLLLLLPTLPPLRSLEPLLHALFPSPPSLFQPFHTLHLSFNCTPRLSSPSPLFLPHPHTLPSLLHSFSFIPPLFLSSYATLSSRFQPFRTSTPSSFPSTSTTLLSSPSPLLLLCCPCIKVRPAFILPIAAWLLRSLSGVGMPRLGSSPAPPGGSAHACDCRRAR